MQNTIAIEYEDTPHGRKLSKNFGVIHRDRIGGHVFAHHYPTRKRLVWTEAHGNQFYVSEYVDFNEANLDFFGRVNATEESA